MVDQAEARLGRRVPTDWHHIEKYPLRAQPVTKPSPVVLGINWYRSFSKPEKVGSRYFIGRGNEWGPIDGGHAICSLPSGSRDLITWWYFYDQVGGSCTGFSTARMLSHYNRERYNALDLYRRGQEIDEWPETPPEEGSSVRAVFEVARTVGPRRMFGKYSYPNDPKLGIEAYRWAGSVEEILSALGYDENHIGIPLINSWGPSYPHIVYLDLDAARRLLREDGEAGVPTDR